MCLCGHDFQAHTDRALFPPCEGAYWPPLVYIAAYYAPVDRLEKACLCQGHNNDG